MINAKEYDGDTHVFLIEEKGTSYRVWYGDELVSDHIGDVRRNLNRWAWDKGLRGRGALARRHTPVALDYFFKLTEPQVIEA